jgi:hypothetical protein
VPWLQVPLFVGAVEAQVVVVVVGRAVSVTVAVPLSPASPLFAH